MTLLAAQVGGCLSTSASLASFPDDAGSPGVDSGQISDPTPEDTSAPPLDASSCQPGDVASFKPKWKPSSAFHQGLCTQEQIVTFKTACIGAKATHQDCAPFTVADSAAQRCAACIKTPDTASIYGPLIDRKGFVELNLAGCLANAENDKDGSGCAGSFQASAQCVATACASNCPVTSTDTLQRYESCAADAAIGGCKEYTQNARCIEGLGDAGTDTSKLCFSGTTFSDHYDVLVPLFCGGDVIDAGGGG